MFRLCIITVCFLQIGSVSFAQASSPEVESVVNTLAQIRVYSESCGLNVNRDLEAVAISEIVQAGTSEKEPLERRLESTYAFEKERASGTCYLSHIDILRMVFKGQLERATTRAPERRTIPIIGIRSSP